MKVFKIKYEWFEGEEQTTYLAKDIGEKDFDRAIIEIYKAAKETVIVNSKKRIGIDCLPNYYKEVIRLLLDKGYEELDVKAIDSFTCYYIDDDCVEKTYYDYKREQLLP